MDCSKTVNFMMERSRMCDMQESCADCVLRKFCEVPLGEHLYPVYEQETVEMAIKALQEWSDAHQPKTRLSLLKEQYPRYEYKNTEGLPVICAGVLYGFSCCCTATNVHDCERCWNTPIEQGVQ